MTLSTPLQEIISECLNNLHTNIGYHFSARERYSIYKLFGPSRLFEPGFKTNLDYFDQSHEWHAEYITFLKSEIKTQKKADLVFSWLCVLTVEKVLPILNHYAFDDESPIPIEMVEVAKTFLAGTGNFENIYWTSFTKYHHGLVPYADLNYQVYCIYSAANEALNLILNSGRGLEIILDNVNDEVLGGATDFANEAVKAYTVTDVNMGGEWSSPEKDLIHQPEITFDSTKRLEFWEWWLTEAIPQAWELAEKGR